MIGEKLKSSAENITGGIKKLGKRNLAICISVLVIAVAICINWALYSGTSMPDDTAPPVDNVTPGDSTETGGETDGVSDNAASYFASVQISRQQARDEALEVLQLVIDSDSAIESAKTDAIADVARIADEIASEANIESLIRAKGFAECVAVINNGKANVVVKTEGPLMQNQVVQIMEIVYEQANIAPENIKITEKY